MKAYVLEGIGKLEYKDVGEPALSPGEVLVKVEAAGICGSDIPRIFQTGTYRFPLIPGHEFAGTVVKAADEEGEEWVGRRVGIFPLIPCRECPSCLDERYEMCGNYNYLGSRCDGGFAEYAAVPVWNLIELPPKIDIRAAAMLEPASVALHAVRKLELKKESFVALLGLGTIGCIMMQWLSYYGVEKAMAAGRRDEFGVLMRETAESAYLYQNVRTVSKEESAADWIRSHTQGRGADILIDCIGTEESLADCLESVKPGGQILVVGNPTGDIRLAKNSYWQILRKQLTLKGTWNSSFLHSAADDWNTAVRACCEGKLKLLPLITHELPFDKLHKGLDLMREKKEYRNKVMIERNPPEIR